jgi:murein DD-endopeptidase MepM/ murein hydrolase activator NlpD
MVRLHGQKGHQGWDIYAPVNTPVVAITDGTVADVRYSRGYGRNLLLAFKHPRYPGGLYAVYAHLCHASVSKGQTVKEGDTLGYTGTDGNAHGHPAHLHFEIRTTLNPSNPDPTNPKNVLRNRISPGEILGGHYNL